MPARRITGDVEAAVLALLGSSPQALSGHAIARALTVRDRPVKPSQVFRALNKLVERNLIHRIELASAYVPGPSSQALHLLCSDCGKRTTLLLPQAAAVAGQIAAPYRFSIRRVILEARGRCSQCRAAVAQRATSRP